MIGFAIIPALITFYISYNYLFEKLLSKKKFVSFLLIAIAVSVFAAISGAAIESLPFLFGSRYLFGDEYRSAVTILSIMTVAAAIHIATGSIMKGFITWYNDIRLKEELAAKNFEMELTLVKSQLNPHFLFNTLNNIDVLIESDPGKASAYFKKLSHIMRFMLYETKSEKIPVVKELSYIEKYVELQQLRSSNPLFVKYNYTGDPQGHFTEPMLFLPFIENAFKHAASKKEVEGIKINFLFEPDKIVFTCANRYDNRPQQQENSGMGFELISRRLQLLYPQKHDLKITKAEGRYTVRLIIQTKQ